MSSESVLLKGKLLQVAGFPCETTTIQLVELLKKIFPDDKLQNVWLDPYREPRAVAMFLHELDETRLNHLIQQLGVKFHYHILTFNTAKPTSSIFVRTYGSLLHGTIDKLSIMFWKRPNRTVQHIHPLDDDCYEITFSEGWDAVQDICKKDWPVGEIKLTVCPYFDCFKEPVVELHEMLSMAEVADKSLQNISTKPPSQMNLSKSTLDKLSNKPNVKLSENSVQETLLEVKKYSDYQRSSEANEKIIVYFKHQSIPILLRCLHFDKALDGYDCCLNIHEDGDSAELEFEISGPKMKVKKVARLLDQEYKKVKCFKTRNNFLALKKILPDLQKGIDATSSFVVLSKIGNDLIFYVTDSRSNKLPFQEFISSLVLEEELTQLPLEDYQQHRKWFDEFNGAYDYGHIFVSDTNVKIMFLSHTKQKMNVMVELMKSKIKLTSLNKAKMKDKDCSTRDLQSLTEPSDKGNARKQENLSGMKSHLEDENIINEVYCFKHSFVLWLLHTLNLRFTVAEFFPTLTLKLDVLDLKVFISGQANQVQAVKQCLKEEDKRLFLTEYENTFLEREKIQSQLLPLIYKHGISLVPDSKYPTQLKLGVKNDKGKIEQIHKFIKSLLVTKACCTLLNQEVYENDAWQTFQESFNSQYNFCEIFVSNNLMVCLLALVHKSEELEMIIRLIIKNSSQHVMTLLNPADSQDINYQEMRQECVEDENTFIKDTAVKKTKDKKRGPTLTLICQNKFFVWLLDQLKFKEVVENTYPGTSVNIYVDENEVVIRGDQAESIKSLVLELDGQISYSEDEETFLQNIKILQQIETTIKSDSMHIVLSDNLECFVQYQDGHQISLEKFASHFVVTKECLSLPSLRFQSLLQWRDLVESLHSKHPLHKISVDGTKVMILTLKDRDEMETNEIQNDLNHLILNNCEKSIRKNSLLRIKEDLSCEKEQYHTDFYQNEGNTKQNYKYGKSHNKAKDSDFIDFLPFSQQQMQYCNVFLQEELQDIQETFKSAEITIQSDGIVELKAGSEHCGYELKARMKSLFDKIINVTKELRYPGLAFFFMSEDGLKLINQMSTKYKCFIEPPMEGANKTNNGLEVLMPEDQRINYKVTLVETAKSPGFKLHLVQEKIRDMKSDVKVNFSISYAAQECVLKTNSSPCDITIVLPRQKALCEPGHQEHFNKLWESLSSVICLVLDQVKYLKSTTVTFDTSALHGMEFAFSLDVIAKIVTEKLVEALTDSSDSSGDIDIYICEPKCESVFKGFSYYMKRMGVDFGRPDPVPWDQICEREQRGRASSPCTDTGIPFNKVFSLPIKYWGKSRAKLNMAHCDIERELNRLMRDNIMTCRFNKKETSNFEKLSNQMRDISVLIYFKKNVIAQNQGQEAKTIITGSELTIQGLCQVLVRDFRELILSVISEAYKLERSWSRLPGDVEWPSRDEDKFSTYDIDPTNTFQHSSSLTFEQNDGHHDEFNKNSRKKEFYANGKSHYYGIDVSKNQRDHNPGTSTFKIIKENKGLISSDTTCQTTASASSHGCVGSFKWLYEASDKTRSGKVFITFKHFYGPRSQMIEAAYSIDKNIRADIKDGKVTHVDFSEMTVKLCGKKKGIIRVEELDSSLQGTKPAVWTVTEDVVWKDINLVERSEQFQKIESELKKKIPVKIKKLNIKRIENINLYQRFKTKNSQLDGGCTFMWHKVSEDNVPLACQFGFHPRFSTMRDENIGDGVLFKVSPWDCLEENEIKDKKTVFLFRSRLALGRTGPGRKRFRCVAQDTKGQPQDSVQVDDQVMIFSDAQAYPSHLITFTFV